MMSPSLHPALSANEFFSTVLILKPYGILVRMIERRSLDSATLSSTPSDFLIAVAACCSGSSCGRATAAAGAAITRLNTSVESDMSCPLQSQGRKLQSYYHESEQRVSILNTFNFPRLILGEKPWAGGRTGPQLNERIKSSIQIAVEIRKRRLHSSGRLHCCG